VTHFICIKNPKPKWQGKIWRYKHYKIKLWKQWFNVWSMDDNKIP